MLKQNAAIVGDADQDSPNSQCDNQRFDTLINEKWEDISTAILRPISIIGKIIIFRKYIVSII